MQSPAMSGGTCCQVGFPPIPPCCLQDEALYKCLQDEALYKCVLNHGAKALSAKQFSGEDDQYRLA